MGTQASKQSEMKFYSLQEVIEDITWFENLKHPVKYDNIPEVAIDTILFSTLYNQYYSNPLPDTDCVDDLKKRISEHFSNCSIPWADELPLEGFSATVYFEKERLKFYKYSQHDSQEDSDVLSRIFNDLDINSNRVGVFSHSLRCFRWFKRNLH